MRRNLSDRLTAIETSIAARHPRWRVVTAETVYADESDEIAEKKSAAAVAADRAKSGWTGEYIVMQPFDTHGKNGTWIGRRRTA